jgi:hypothetical protein
MKKRCREREREKHSRILLETVHEYKHVINQRQTTINHDGRKLEEEDEK